MDAVVSSTPTSATSHGSNPSFFQAAETALQKAGRRASELNTEVGRRANELHHKVSELHQKHSSVLREAVPEVAIIFPVDHQLDEKARPSEILVKGSAEVNQYGVPHRLMILQYETEEAEVEEHLNASSKIKELMVKIHDWGVLDIPVKRGLQLAWPLHRSKISAAILAVEAEELTFLLGKMEGWPPWRKRLSKLLRVLKFTVPPLDGVTCDAFEDQFGTGVEFMFAWSAFYIQHLWVLTIYGVFWVAIDGRTFSYDPDKRWIWELLKVGVIIWAVWVAWRSSHRFPEAHADAVCSFEASGTVSSVPEEGKVRKVTIRSGRETIVLGIRNTTEKPWQYKKRLATLYFAALPCFALVIFMSACVLTSVTMLIIYIIYIWGDCLNLHSQDDVCRDAEVKHAALGWLAEVSCDVLCAILFELFFPIGKAISKWVASLMNYELESDELFVEEMCELLLSAVERIGFVGSLAFLFAPQWVEPMNDGINIDRTVSCDDLLFGDASYMCYHRRLPVKIRRWVFESLMKGPFMVAPFISILIKFVIPKVAQQISRFCGLTLRHRCCFFMAPFRCVFRLVALIFTYDGDTVSCFTYAFKGPNTFSKVPADNPESKVLNSALEQVLMKPFEVEDELMEIEMSFLWVTFFTPILPTGVLVTMIAKFIEHQTDLGKMLFVRRRPIPRTDRIMRMEMNTYVKCVAIASVGWSAGLSMITYNDYLWEWGAYSYLTMGLVILWLISTTLVMSKSTNKKARVVNRK